MKQPGLRNARRVQVPAGDRSSRVRVLQPSDAAALIALRREALESDPLAFAASLQDDRALSLDFVRHSLANRAESAVLGFFAAEQLAGMAGILRPTDLKSRHKAQIWGMYVSSAHRKKGAGSSLLQAAIEKARQWPGVLQIHLSATEAAEEAGRLYERAGFREWGREPRALCWEGRFVAERHLVLPLDAPATVV